MTAEVYAQWKRLQGFRIVQTDSSLWVSEGYGIYQAFPYHVLIDPSEREISHLYRQERALACRYSISYEKNVGAPSYHIVCESKDYDFQNLGHRTRKNVRRGLRNCEVATLSFEKLIEGGWNIHLDTLNRQRRRTNGVRNEWDTKYLAAADLPGFAAWGASVSGQLAAYIVSFQMGTTAYILDHQCKSEHLATNVNNAITYTVTRNLIRSDGINCVFYGMESLDAPPTVDEFKLHMGYQARAVRQRISFHPLIAPAVNTFSYAALEMLARHMPGQRTISKARGLMRTYLGRAETSLQMTNQGGSF